MKKYILLVIIVGMVFNANAQKLEKPEIDKITGHITYGTKEEVIANKLTLIGHYLACKIRRGHSFYLLYFHAKDGLAMDYFVREGDKAIIKFSNGKILELSAIVDSYSSIIPYASPPVTESLLPYDLSDEDITALENGKISVIRILTSIGPFDYDISDGKSEIIKKQLQLITKAGR